MKRLLKSFHVLRRQNSWTFLCRITSFVVHVSCNLMSTKGRSTSVSGENISCRDFYNPERKPRCATMHAGVKREKIPAVVKVRPRGHCTSVRV